MRSRSRTPSAQPLGLRHGHERGARSEARAPEAKRRRRNRPGTALRLLLATAAILVPHHGKSEPSKRSRRDLVPVVTTRVEGAIAVPPRHAYETLIREAAARYGVEAALIKAIMQAESAFDALAVSRAGARGLMQLMPALAKELGVQDPFDARQNVMGGARYLRRLLDLYDNNLRLVLAGYNAGETSVRQYGGVPPFRETQHYVRRVMGLLERARRENNDRSRTLPPSDTGLTRL